ncbi:MAG: hypothetical protein LUF28_10545 [Clostridiales bacterium]|nr:hypothetical protein [Clostridiales bacterium]
MNHNDPLKKAAVKGFQICLICAAALLLGSAIPILGYLGGLFDSQKVLALGLVLLIVGTVLLVTGFFGFVKLLGLGKGQPTDGPKDEDGC